MVKLNVYFGNQSRGYGVQGDLVIDVIDYIDYKIQRYGGGQLPSAIVEVNTGRTFYPYNNGWKKPFTKWFSSFGRKPKGFNPMDYRGRAGGPPSGPRDHKQRAAANPPRGPRGGKVQHNTPPSSPPPVAQPELLSGPDKLIRKEDLIAIVDFRGNILCRIARAQEETRINPGWKPDAHLILWNSKLCVCVWTDSVPKIKELEASGFEFFGSISKLGEAPWIEAINSLTAKAAKLF